MKDGVEIAKGILQIVRNVLIGLFVALVLIAPGFVNTRLNAAGVKEAKIGGVTWAAQAGGAISSAKLGVQDVTQALTEVAGKTKDPSVQNTIKDAIDRLRLSQVSIDSADQSIKLSVAQGQQAQTSAIQAGSQNGQKGLEGWVFIGRVTQDKSKWIFSNAQKVSGGDPDLNAKEQQLQTSDSLYLRAPTAPGQHASGAVLAVTPNGATLQVLEMDTSSHALSGGWFVWARVKTT